MYMDIGLKIDLNKLKSLDKGNLCFLIGVFLIGSAFPFGILFLFASLLISILKNKYYFFRDKWNYPFIFISIVLLVSATTNFLNPFFIGQNKYDHSSILIDLFNWIPFFICFWGFQPYLKSEKQRINFIKAIIAGSILY